jgi:putative endonuclease
MDDDIAPAVYILASRYRGTMYIGATSALWDRVAAHKDEAFKGFTSKYKIKTLVWYEHHTPWSMPSGARSNGKRGNGSGSSD